MLTFSGALESSKITVSVRQTRGLDANAACGQLRNKFQKTPLVTDPFDLAVTDTSMPYNNNFAVSS